MSEKSKLVGPLMRFVRQVSKDDFIPGLSWRGREPNVDALVKGHEKNAFLYHSSPADPNDLRHGIEPRNPSDGGWIRENAMHSGLDESMSPREIDEYFEALPRAAWFSDKPSWVSAFVGRKIGKDINKVNQRDIVDHGHLAIAPRNILEREGRDVFYLGEDGVNGPILTLDGKKKKIWETPLYSHDYRFGDMTPEGLERNEYVATESIDPLLQLRGRSLLEFLYGTGYAPRKARGGKVTGALRKMKDAAHV